MCMEGMNHTANGRRWKWGVSLERDYKEPTPLKLDYIWAIRSVNIFDWERVIFLIANSQDGVSNELEQGNNGRNRTWEDVDDGPGARQWL